ncbi:sulfatase [Urechidicola vernalis]|uniref:Sulfatase n=1 Tax=Urechidicola vernalis TaxID=3075600 RepID=A0ABU2Y227_9FLAO|nr:sulfatase [Urechidicola sp. P050]MDT0551861.1 sulfatase [Urechidicola sp. P050]
MRSFFVRFITLFIGLTIYSQQTEKSSTKPNILMIMVDDLNDYQGAFGGHTQAKTPNIDKLAESGTKFTNAHTNVPVCSPSRNSLFTGIYPHNSRDFGWTPHFKQAVLKNHKTFIEYFKENGYQTLGTGKLLHKNVKSYWDDWGVPEGINYGPHAYSGIDKKGKRIMGHSSVPEPFRSINVVDGSFASLADTPITKNENGTIIETGWTYGQKRFRYENDNDRDLMPDEQHALWVKHKIKELELNVSNKPFFMGVGFVNPHTPLYAPQKYFDMFPLNEIQLPLIKENDNEDIHYSSVYDDTEMGLAYYKKLRKSYPNEDEGLRKFLQAYLACIAFMDDQVGIVMDAIDNSKFKDNTIVVFVSDHGWQMGEKEYLYKNSPWDESTRIPFIIRAPKFSKPKSEVHHAVSLIDIFPTLKDLCNLKGRTLNSSDSEKLDGYSLKPFLENQNSKNWKGPNGALTVLGAAINKPIEGIGFSSNPGALWHIQITKDLKESYVKQQNYSYRTEHWRYILYHNGKEELYNIKKDAKEWNNLADDTSLKQIKTQLKSEMMELIN